MRVKEFIPGTAALFVAALLAGCGGSEQASTQAGKTSAVPTASVATSETVAVSDECEALVADFAETADGSEELDTLGLQAPQRCTGLAELRAALAEQFGAESARDLEELVISGCVAGDAWALLGEPSVIADTALCREARSSYNVVAGRRLVPAQAMYADDFSGGCRGWSTDRDERAELSCTHGAYRVLVLNPDRPQHSRLFRGRGLRGTSVEADATLIKPRAGEFEFHGVSCWSSRRVGYLFLLEPDGSYVILKDDEATGHRSVLKQGRTEHAIPGVGVRNRIRGDCDVRGDRVRLELFVNGDRVAVVKDTGESRSFTGFGLFVGTSERGTDVRFDNVLVRGPTS